MARLDSGGAGGGDSDDGSDGDTITASSLLWDRIAEGIQSGYNSVTGTVGMIGGGVASVPVKLRDYIDRDASLLGKFDFLGLLADISKATLIAIMSIVSGMILGTAHALGLVTQAIEDTIWNIATAPFDGMAIVQKQAVAAVGQELQVFGLLALPTATATTVAALGGVALVLYLFIGPGLID